jgi:ABC-type transporter MlaC component
MSLISFFSRFLLPGLALCATLSATPAHAADGDAEATIRQLIENVSTDLQQLHQQNRIGDRAALEGLINADIMPGVDKERLTRRVFRQYWSQITKAGREADATQRVVAAVTRTYAVALSGYSGDTITVVDVNPRKNNTVAKTRIRRPNGQTIQVDFSLAEKDGKWLINDMAVVGIVISLTLFNAMKSTWDAQGMDAALATLATTDVQKSGQP